jgi:hypothetical protein
MRVMRATLIEFLLLSGCLKNLQGTLSETTALSLHTANLIIEITLPACVVLYLHPNPSKQLITCLLLESYHLSFFTSVILKYCFFYVTLFESLNIH